MQFCKLGQYLYLQLVQSTGMKSLLWLQPQNVHFSPFQCHSSAIPVHSCSIPADSGPFLWIPVSFLRTPADSSGMGSSLQESVGHDEVLGASRTHGGILRGRALGNRPNLADMDTTMDNNIPYPSKIHLYVTSSTNPADWALQSMSHQVLKHPVTTSLKVILQHISERHSLVQSKSSQIQISCISFLLIRA